ncbi:hypothetical protein YA38_15075 [Klebsiella aerogenes]|nr:hypothetical protein YA38_15075 [Klebsiella aerogenes]
MVKHDDKGRDSAESVEMFIMLQVKPCSLFGFIFVVFHNQRVKKKNLTAFVYIATLMLTGGYFLLL